MTKNLEIYIIELPKFEKYAQENKELDTWVKFIKNLEVMNINDVKNNKALEKAKNRHKYNNHLYRINRKRNQKVDIKVKLKY